MVKKRRVEFAEEESNVEARKNGRSVEETDEISKMCNARLMLMQEWDTARVRAAFSDGLLQFEVPKKAVGLPTRILML